MSAPVVTAATASPPPTGRAPLGRPGLLRLVAVELRKSVDTTTGRWLLGISAFFTVAVLAVLVVASERWDWSFTTFLEYAILPAGIFLPILGVLLITGEFSQRTTLTTFTLVSSRNRVALAKTGAAITLAVATWVVIIALCAAATGVAVALDRRVPWDADPVVLAQTLLASVIGVVSGLAFGLLLQNTPLAVVTFLLLPTVIGVAFLLPGLEDVGSWLSPDATAPLLGSTELDRSQWARAGVSFTVWTALPLVLGWLRLLRRELS